MLIIKKHLSLLIMFAGAAAQLLGSLFLYKMMDPVQYGLYGLFITFLSIVFSFGLLGAEQTFMRACSIQSDTVSIDKSIVLLLVICFLIGPAVLVLITSLVFMKGISGIELYLVAVIAALVMFGYNYQRVLGNFSESQLLNNFWRIAILASLLWGGGNISVKVVFALVFVGLLISALFFLYRLFVQRRFEVESNNNGIGSVVKLSLSFLFSMGVLTALNFFDRYLIGAKFDVESFGDFFFLQNVFVYPFVLIANYFGFRSLVKYKKTFDIGLFNRQLALLSIIAPMIATLYVLLALLFDSLFPFSFGFSNFTGLIIPLVLFGCIKLVYSILSAAMGARGHATDIVVVNFISIVFAIGAALSLMNFDVTIEIVAWVMVLLWFLRCVLYYFSVRRFANEI